MPRKNKILIRTGSTAPAAVDFVTSEPAWDSSAGKLYVKNAAGVMVHVGPNEQTITLTGDVTGSGTGSFAATLSNSGVSAGTYTSVTVDAKGRVTAGTSTQAWSTITSTPTTLTGYGITDAVSSSDARLTDARTPLSHTHGNITNAGAIGSTANLPLITTTSGVVTTGSFGTAAATFCQGNDSRLSDSRTPTAHASTHASGGSDAISIAASQITSGTIATARLGSGTADATTYLRGDGAWSTISGGGIVEAATPASFPATGQSATLYLATDTSRLFRWVDSTTKYIEVGPVGGGDTALWSLFIPPAPTSVSGAPGNTQVSLNWTAPTVAAQTPITSYTVQYSSNSGSSWTTWSGSVTTNSATITGLVNGTAYIFRVSATNAVGTGSVSANSASVTPSSTLTGVDWLVVAGGGSGGARVGGGGGAGGLRSATNQSLSYGVAYTVTVGKGGGAITQSGATGLAGASGYGSTFNTTSTTGGGGGGAYSGISALTGGSGGGAGGYNSGGAATGAAGTAGEGNAGGNGVSGAGGGGGGSAAVGAAGASNVGGAGGNGTSSSITGVATVYAAGGGGSGDSGGGAGGSSGVGGAGTTAMVSPAGSGAANTGSGGGAARNSSDGTVTSGAGAHGTVIIAVPGNVTATISGFTLGSGYTRDTSSRSGYTVFTFYYAGAGNQTTGSITF